MTRATRWVIFGLVCLSAASANAQTIDSYSGRWKMTSMKVDVTIESWGDNCGPRPRSYASNRTQSVDIYARGQHLIFSKGGVRTDRCWSPNNPRIKTLSSSALKGSWKRICQTPKDDPKFERGEYTLSAIDDDTLAYLAVSKFEWTLKGDHCTARLVEKRRYVRDKEDGDPVPTQPKPQNEEVPSQPDPEHDLHIETDVDDVLPDDGCSPSGPVKRLSIMPETARLKPGERVCFKVFGFDAADCRHKVNAAFRATQGGQTVPGLIKGDCFVAGQTAAESEGVYDVTGRVGHQAISARVEVIFPDLGELIAARLSPLDDFDDIQNGDAQEPPPAAPNAPEKSSGDPAKNPIPGVSQLSPRGEEPPTLLIVTIAIGALFVGGFALVFLVLRRRKNEPRDDEDFDSWPDEAPLSRPPSSTLPSDADSPDSGLVCPTCKETFLGEAKFCPHDRTPLVPASRGERQSRGMVCPVCHRGYEADARFCPHDSAALLSYHEWRAQQKTS